MHKRKDLRPRVLALLDEWGWSRSQLATQIPDYAQSTIWNWLAGSYTETPGLREAVEAFLARAERGEIGPTRSSRVVSIERAQRNGRRPPKRHEHYETETVRQVFSTIDYAAETASIALIAGDFGCGKTHAAKLWRARHSDVDSMLFEFDDNTASRKLDFLEALAESLGIPEAVTTHNGARVFRRIVARLRETPSLLIFDQCEMVSIRVLQIIRQIWDRTREAGVGVALMAAPLLLARIERRRGGDLGALKSRIGVWVALRGVEREEMAAIIRNEGLTDVDDAAFELWWRAIGGSMRWLMESVDLLRERHQGKRIGERTVIGVCQRLLGIAIPASGLAGPARRQPPAPGDAAEVR